ncbi:putative NagC family transcriptional regulator [Microlunatus phosphovorus NM-1]|uniref:Putative NagC family transcriptional regulator n=1 Tax=Microlunatus phosphovorus (strain ATCC 700054 / DSM 10555 / JCM 9379 / NBRC 101784 / NCIMB 13414 / VKM Ac-1990 / NM-1) TaxID=1032480 RepID=F5XLW3_MICPN|nr:putative NagC family transcriptional regulator [Microlunatus phosphovorus NM-1]
MGDQESNAGVASTRRGNLSRLLTSVHRDGPSSRAALTRQTGLNRSTIAGLVAELVGAGLVSEGIAESARSVGRPSPLVIAESSVVALTVNPDIDAVTLGLVGLGGVVHKRVRYPTSGSLTADEAVNLVEALVAGMRSELDSRFSVLGIGVAVPGLVERATGTVTLAPHLRWRDEPFAARLTEATGYRCVVANDARTALVAEGLFGAGRGRPEFVYLNGSASGIGGGIVAAGRPVLGRHGYAGEFGHRVVHPGGLPCHCGRIGCLETEVRRDRLLAAVGLDDVTAEQLPQALTEALAEGLTRKRSTEVRAELDRQVGWLAQGLSDVVTALDPEAVVLGGFLATLADASDGRLQELVRSTGFAALSGDIEVVAAELGTDLLTIGAAELIFADLLADPQSYASLAS